MKKIRIPSSWELHSGACFAAIVLAFLALFASNLAAQDKEDPELQRVFSQMDSVGKNFRSFSAKYLQKKYTAVLKEFDAPETGLFYYKRAKDGSALLRKEAMSPGKNILTIKDAVATSYQPSIKQAQVFNLGKNKDKAEYLAIGISQSPAKLQENFNVSYQGNDSVNGKPCSVLLFKPKNPKEAAYFSNITVWFSKSNGLSLQYKLQEPNGDYILMTYSEEKLNASIPDSKFDQKFSSAVGSRRY